MPLTGESTQNKLIKVERVFNTVAVIVIVVICLVLFLPQLAFISLSLTKAFPNDLSFTLEHIANIFSNTHGVGLTAYIWNLLSLAVPTALLGTAFAYLLGYLSVRKSGRMAKAVDPACAEYNSHTWPCPWYRLYLPVQENKWIFLRHGSDSGCGERFPLPWISVSACQELPKQDQQRLWGSRWDTGYLQGADHQKRSDPQLGVHTDRDVLVFLPEQHDHNLRCGIPL